MLLNLKEKVMSYSSMNEDELYDELYKLRDSWNIQNHLASDYNEGLRYNQIRNLLKSKFNATAEIILNQNKDEGTTPYEVKIG